MESAPFVSVIIPTFHRDDLLSLCLNCLMPGIQTLPFEEYEVIVSDDGTNTVTKELVATKYPWVTYTQGPRQGPAANRNNGASYAKGKWLAFTDDDCLPDKNWLQSFKNSIFTDEGIQVLEGKTICLAGIKSPIETAPINENGGVLWSCNFAIKKEYFDKIGKFNTAFPFPNMEDVEFRNKIITDGERMLFVSEAVVDHPPRKMKFGKNLAMQHESSYYYWHNVLGEKRITRKLVGEILKFRINTILKHTFSLDTIVAVGSMIEELAFTFYFLTKWPQKYKHAK